MATKAVAEDQKKRALDALERRFAVAKAEVEHQLRDKRRRVDSFLESGPSASSRGPSVKASPACAHINSVKKDLEGEGFTYAGISQPVHDNLLSAVESSYKDKTTVDKILQELLQKGDSAHKYIQGSRSIKLDNWILLDNFVQGKNTSVARLRAFQANSKRSKKHMSMKQPKKFGLLDLPQELHNMCFEFMKEENRLEEKTREELSKTKNSESIQFCRRKT